MMKEKRKWGVIAKRRMALFIFFFKDFIYLFDRDRDSQ